MMMNMSRIEAQRALQMTMAIAAVIQPEVRAALMSDAGCAKRDVIAVMAQGMKTR